MTVMFSRILASAGVANARAAGRPLARDGGYSVRLTKMEQLVSGKLKSLPATAARDTALRL